MTRVAAAFILALVHAAAPAARQPARSANLVVTAADPSGAVIPNAAVSIVGLEDATKAVAVPTARTTATGSATFQGSLRGGTRSVPSFPGSRPASSRTCGSVRATTDTWSS